jgi:hypothetical protein
MSTYKKIVPRIRVAHRKRNDSFRGELVSLGLGVLGGGISVVAGAGHGVGMGGQSAAAIVEERLSRRQK